MNARQRAVAARAAAIKTRDSEIVRRFTAGESRKQLAHAFGLTPRRVGQIAEAHGARHTRDQIQMIEMDGLRRRVGRPLMQMPDTLRREYNLVRRILGAAEARKLLDKAA